MSQDIAELGLTVVIVGTVARTAAGGHHLHRQVAADARAATTAAAGARVATKAIQTTPIMIATPILMKATSSARPCAMQSLPMVVGYIRSVVAL
eukprot:COSAG02_NODE_5727_length_4089_cov_2.288471_5_plen_94_part_00